MSNDIIIHTNTNRLGITLPGDVIEQIDIQRGDVARSRFILRLIESSLKQDKEAK
jgi:metal-responsive CopG/Arc/MetJ family transcriptional regulator